MANKTYYEKGNKYVNASGNPVIEKKGNQLIFTDNFDAGGGGELPIASASTRGGVKVGEGLNVTAGGVLSVATPAYSTEPHLTGRKWIDGRDIWEKTIIFSEPLNITTSYTTIETDTDVDVPISMYAVDPTYKACMPLKAGVENATLKAIAFDAQFTAETVTVEYVKAITPAETTNTRTVKKTVKKG